MVNPLTVSSSFSPRPPSRKSHPVIADERLRSNTGWEAREKRKKSLPKHSRKQNHGGGMGPGPSDRGAFSECMAAYSTPLNPV